MADDKDLQHAHGSPRPGQAFTGGAAAPDYVKGYLTLVLHAHLPFIRHPEHRYHLEENWLYEATTATYLPLLDVFRSLAREGVPFRLTLSLSPPLVTMLRDDLLKTRTAAYLDRLLALGDDEMRRTQHDPTFNRIARFYADRF